MTPDELSSLFFRPDLPENNQQAVSFEMVGFFAEALRDLNFEANAATSYLALACGTGIAELELARLLQIPQENITAVDLNPKVASDKVKQVSMDMVHFIRQATERGHKFNLITLLRLDYVLNNPAAYKDLFKAISEIILPGGWLVFTEGGNIQLDQETLNQYHFVQKTIGIYQAAE